MLHHEAGACIDYILQVEQATNRQNTLHCGFSNLQFTRINESYDGFQAYLINTLQPHLTLVRLLHVGSKHGPKVGDSGSKDDLVSRD